MKHRNEKYFLSDPAIMKKMCLYIINYTPTFYFPCIINLKVSLGREKCIEHCRGCRSGDMARPGRGGARRGQWGKFGVAQAAVQIFIFTPDSAVTPTNMTQCGE